MITTVDHGVYHDSIKIIWSYPSLYKHHIVLLGGFHLNKNYLSRLGSKLEHSGFGDIILEAKLTTGGTLKGILNCSGNLYNKTLYIYKVLLEALERLLFEVFMESEDCSTTVTDEVNEMIQNFIDNPTKKHSR